ncbi:MAG: RNA polymerase sporulation sigma factor SigH [Lachnospiraceae bacterium]|nr:RNA polymerase sporulation sigma factor SigH [Lachnospiraceae bacterium]
MNEEKFKQASDEELILMYRDGEEEAAGFLMNKYKNLVRKKAGSMYILGGDREDLIQEGMIGLYKAVRDYDMGRDVNFYTFADLCVSRQMYTAVQASNRQKHLPLNTYISIYGQNMNPEEGSGEYDLINTLVSRIESNPEEMMIAQENMEQMENAIIKELSELEKQVFELHLTGMNYTEIAKVLGRDEKSTDNALQRMKGKIKKLLKN